MGRLLTSIPALVLVAGMIVAPGPAGAQAVAQTTCEWYARTAVKQQQENEQKKCGFKGPAWTSDLKAHQAWCASVSPEEWRRSAQKRDQDLAACARK
jgi:hypothetical protein